jgi:hypothetical protein
MTRIFFATITLALFPAAAHAKAIGYEARYVRMQISNRYRQTAEVQARSVLVANGAIAECIKTRGATNVFGQYVITAWEQTSCREEHDANQSAVATPAAVGGSTASTSPR